MILEIAQIEVKRGLEDAFEDGIAKAAAIIQATKGRHGFEVVGRSRGRNGIAY